MKIEKVKKIATNNPNIVWFVMAIIGFRKADNANSIWKLINVENAAICCLCALIDSAVFSNGGCSDDEELSTSSDGIDCEPDSRSSDEV